MTSRKLSRITYITAVGLIIAALLSGCGLFAPREPETLSPPEASETIKTPETTTETPETTTEETSAETEIVPRQIPKDEFDVAELGIPAYDGQPYVEMNDGEPYFTEEDLVTEHYIELSELDELHRCGSNMMCADEEHMASSRRGRISYKPSGWHGGGFYQRSHLLMRKLSDCDESRNLISGTATFNQETMLEWEERVTAYIWAHKGIHVIYRVSPWFEGDNLIATGVLMEACSVEDEGGLKFCVFCYNVEPDATIDYRTGEYVVN